MERPTESAIASFETALFMLRNMPTLTTAEVHSDLKVALMYMAVGMKHLSVGTRATYMLLEQVRREARTQPGARV